MQGRRNPVKYHYLWIRESFQPPAGNQPEKLNVKKEVKDGKK
jgi:hypothetical protein